MGPGKPQARQTKEITVPFVNVKLVEGVFTEEEKHQMAAALTDVMVKFEGSEAFREVVWVRPSRYPAGPRQGSACQGNDSQGNDSHRELNRP
jgi:hypothetical protein